MIKMGDPNPLGTTVLYPNDLASHLQIGNMVNSIA